MVHFMLYVTAELENLTNLQPSGGVDDPNFTYFVKLLCEKCGEVTKKEACLRLNEKVDLAPNKVTNLLQECKLCKREGTVTMKAGRGIPLTIHHSQTEQFAPAMLFDCNGFVPVSFEFSTGWKAESLSGTIYDEIDLSGEGEFCEFDAKGKYGVMICNVRAFFDVVADPHKKVFLPITV